MESGEINVAVIDDGVNKNLFEIKYLKYNIEITSDLRIKQNISNEFDLSITHGTICASIIKKYAPKSVISSIKILDNESGKSNKYQLILAIKWCVLMKIKLINISLGTTQFIDFKEIRAIINFAYKNGVIIVAAYSNEGVYTIPACLENVIGVKSDKDITDDKYKFNIYSLDGVDIVANGRFSFKDKLGNYQYSNISNSFATPTITAKVHNIILEKQKTKLEEIKKELYFKAINCNRNDYNPYFSINADWIDVCYKIDLQNEKKIVLSKKEEILIFNIKQKNNWYKRSDDIKEFFKKADYNNVILSSNYNITKLQYKKFGVLISNKFWCNKFYVTNLKKNLPRKISEIDIPIILICSHCKNDIAYRLNELFMDDLYYSKFISNNFIDIIDGCEYFPSGVNIKKYLSFIYSKYNCDLILLDVTNIHIIKEIQKKLNFDITIKIYSENMDNRLIASLIINNTIIKSIQITNTSIYKIYEIINNILTDRK